MLSQARALWRGARALPVLRDVLAAVDRVWWARTIRAADVVDVDFVAAQVGTRLSARAAVRRYVRGGFRAGLSLNPLYLERTISRQLPDANRVPALYAYLVNDRTRLEVSPLWDAPGIASQHPQSLSDPAGPLGFVWRRARRQGWVELGRGESSARVSWNRAVHATSSPPPRSAPPRPSGPLLVCVLGAREPDGDDALALALHAATALELDVDLVLTGTSVTEAAHAALLPLIAARISVRHAPGVRTAEPDDTPRPAMTAFRGPQAMLAGGDLARLVEAAADRPSAALWLAPDATVASAGTVFHEGRALPLLAGHPVEDARRAGTAIPVPRLSSPARAWPAGSSPHGPGQVLTAITVTAPVPPAGDTADRPAPDTDIDALLRPAGFEVETWRDGHPDLRRIPRPGESAARRRWAIKTAAPAGTRGEAWGDTHFARGVAAALERLGDEAVVDALPARDRATGRFDDVTLVLRGPERIRPRHGRALLWIISHPDEITAEELADFDHVFAASTPWAQRATARFGRPIVPLLQCTDSTRFRPAGLARTDEIVFVGTARGIARPVVVEPVRAGIPVRVYGPDWRGYIPASAIAATGIPNDELAGLYERAAVVLNDHWPAMQREGFISNRLYDVVAAGGRAVSDEVAGIAEVFGGSVVTYSTPGELVDILRSDLDARFPDRAAAAANSALVRERDSFDARARTLMDYAARG